MPNNMTSLVSAGRGDAFRPQFPQPVNLTIQGLAYRSSESTSTGKNFFKVHFQAPSDFALKHPKCSEMVWFHPKQLGDPIFPGPNCIFDFDLKSMALKADRMEFLQPVDVDIRLNDAGFVVLDRLQVTGAIQFNPDYDLRLRDLEAFQAAGGVLPETILSQMEVNRKTPKTGMFTIYPHGPWISPTGNPADLKDKNYRS